LDFAVAIATKTEALTRLPTSANSTFRTELRPLARHDSDRVAGDRVQERRLAGARSLVMVKGLIKIRALWRAWPERGHEQPAMASRQPCSAGRVLSIMKAA